MNDKKQVTLEPTVGMAVLDIVPVIFFAATTLFASWFFYLESPLTSIINAAGAFLAFLAGLGKVIWKFIRAIQKKDIVFFRKQFRFTMTAGFTLITAACVIFMIKVDAGYFLDRVLFNYPISIFLGIGLCFFIAMCIYGLKADFNTARANWIEEILNSLAQIFIFLYIILTFFVLMAL